MNYTIKSHTTQPMNEILSKLGLTSNEIQIYKYILRNANLTAAAIAKDLNLDKSSTYRACENLLRLGLLINSPKKRGTTYIANSPEALTTLHANKQAELETLEKQLPSLINTLKNEKSGSNRNVQIRTEYGLEAIRRIMVESLSSKDKLIREWQQTDKSYYRQDEQVDYILKFAKKRIDLGIKIKQLEANTSFIDSGFKTIMTSSEKHLKEIRLMPKGFEDNNTLRVWDNTVNIISFDDQEEYVVVTIKDRYIANIIRNLFDFVWKQSTKF